MTWPTTTAGISNVPDGLSWPVGEPRPCTRCGRWLLPTEMVLIRSITMTFVSIHASLLLRLVQNYLPGPIAERGAEAPRRLPYATFSLSRDNSQMPSRTEIVELSLRHIHRPDQP